MPTKLIIANPSNPPRRLRKVKKNSVARGRSVGSAPRTKPRRRTLGSAAEGDTTMAIRRRKTARKAPPSRRRRTLGRAAKRRNPAKKNRTTAAEKKKIAEAAAGLVDGAKDPKRVEAGRKAAETRARNAAKAARAASKPKKGGRRKSTPKTRRKRAGAAAARRLLSTKKVRRASTLAKRRKSTAKSPAARRQTKNRRRIARWYVNGKRMQAKIARGTLSKQNAKYAREHGITKLNPSLKGLAKSLWQAKGLIGAGLAGLAATAWAGAKLRTAIAERAAANPEGLAAKYASSAIGQHAAAISTGVVTLIGWAILRAGMKGKWTRFSLPFLVGGAGATLVHFLASSRGEDGMSLGQKLGLPLGAVPVTAAMGNGQVFDVAPDMVGDYVETMGDYVETMGDYVPPPSSNAAMMDIGINGYGHMGALPMAAEFDPRPSRMGSLSGGIFDKRTL